jgi:hypothetical protein
MLKDCAHSAHAGEIVTQVWQQPTPASLFSWRVAKLKEIEFTPSATSLPALYSLIAWSGQVLLSSCGQPPTLTKTRSINDLSRVNCPRINWELTISLVIINYWLLIPTAISVAYFIYLIKNAKTTMIQAWQCKEAANLQSNAIKSLFQI